MAAYDRARDLPGLLPLWPNEIADASIDGREAVIAKLERACRSERARGALRPAHWTYDINRHAQLIAAYEAERRELDALSARRAA